jgi:DNA-binding transcriptional regulator GbsR (MarR family)
MGKLSSQQRRFIDDLAALLGTWSLPANAARLYGYLQIANQPVSLDDIARDLEISRSHAHVAARLLEGHANARRVGLRGTKRAYYVASDDPSAPLRPQVEALGRMASLIASHAHDVTAGAARDRLLHLAGFHSNLQKAMETVVTKVRKTRVGAAAAQLVPAGDRSTRST